MDIQNSEINFEYPSMNFGYQKMYIGYKKIDSWIPTNTIKDIHKGIFDIRYCS